MGIVHELVYIWERLGRIDVVTRAWFVLGRALQHRGRYREALVAFHRMLDRSPASTRALSSIARVHLAIGEPDKAIPYLHKALALRSDDDGARVALGDALHLIGDREGGWDAFARHYYPPGRNERAFEQPLWDGSPLRGKTILLWSKKGRGDVILFLRYVDFAHQAGGRVVVECHHDVLLPVIERMDHVDRVVLRGTPLPTFDVHAPLYCFPAVVPSSRSFSATGPYLSADPALVAAWRNRLQPARERTVGICWGGAAGHDDAASRFISLAAFAPLSRVPGIRLISLQHGPQAAELSTPPDGLRVERLGGDGFSVADAAALVSNLDLTITVDTMLAHLAGALGRPVWTLLRREAHWLWQISGDSTPWYPTMRLFRQPRLGDWATVFVRVQTALETCDWQTSTATKRSGNALPLNRRPHR
jgi:Tetratricopeptide repeat/Glycosyltransferase family 9 (heptosyltransferase)